MDITTLTVYQLNRQIRLFLEQDIGEICVLGELSNVSRPASGHIYFTLKDEQAQLKCAFFRNYHGKNAAKTHEVFSDGQQVLARGLVSLYEARGDYQLIVHELTPYGLGELARQFELLKIQLTEKGLFSETRKRKLPIYPKKIAVITSPSGAALHDILTTLARRYPIAEVYVYPSEVQGVNAAPQLIHRIRQANQDNHCDVIILARGGGSLEDLWAFNDEQLALAIYNSAIPVITGVGHETDFTIADFVSDYRAATPTAAAEAATPSQLAMQQFIESTITRLNATMRRRLLQQKTSLSQLENRLAYPSHLVHRHAQTLDFLHRQLCQTIQQQWLQKQYRMTSAHHRLQANNPTNRIKQGSQDLLSTQERLVTVVSRQLAKEKTRFATLLATLHAVSPLATLDRGYAIAIHQTHVIHDVQSVNLGDVIDIQLAKGTLCCKVIDKKDTLCLPS